MYKRGRGIREKSNTGSNPIHLLNSCKGFFFNTRPGRDLRKRDTYSRSNNLAFHKRTLAGVSAFTWWIFFFFLQYPTGALKSYRPFYYFRIKPLGPDYGIRVEKTHKYNTIVFFFFHVERTLKIPFYKFEYRFQRTQVHGRIEIQNAVAV